MSKKGNREFWQSVKSNSRAFTHYYNQLVEIALATFKWNNLPSTIDERFLELSLLTYGQAVFFKDEEMGYLALHSANTGPFDVYRIPKNRRAYAVNGYTNTLTNENSVLIYNNMLHTNTLPDLEWYAERLAQYDGTIDTNIKAQKTPILIECDNDELLTMKNLYLQYAGDTPVIFGKKKSKLNSGFNVLRTDAPFTASNVQEIKNQIWNEALTFLGISNVNVVKKERLVSDEVRRNLGGTYANRSTRLTAREQACRMINEMFGLDVSCEFRDDINILNEDLFNPPEIVVDEEVSTNE